MAIQTSEVRLEGAGKPIQAYLDAPAGGGPGVLVLPSWFGLKPYFKEACDRLARQGYTALGLDYYNGRMRRRGFWLCPSGRRTEPMTPRQYRLR